MVDSFHVEVIKSILDVLSRSLLACVSSSSKSKHFRTLVYLLERLRGKTTLRGVQANTNDVSSFVTGLDVGEVEGGNTIGNRQMS